MSLKLGINIGSLKAQNELQHTSAELAATSERLSSGLRINHASDDAASLSIVSILDSKQKLTRRAILNLNDGISVLSIADSALDSLSTIVTRLQELSGQSSNGVISNSQRSAIDAEAQALSKEYSRIIKSTTFNGRNVLNDTLANVFSLQAGTTSEGRLDGTLGTVVGSGTFGGSQTYSSEGNASDAVTLADLNNDGILDLISGGSTGSSGAVTVRLGAINGTFGAATTYATETGQTRSVTVGDLNNDGILDLITAGDGGGIGQVNVRLGNGDGTFAAARSYTADQSISIAVSLADINGDGVLDIVTAGLSAGTGSAYVRLGSGNGTFGAATSYQTEYSYSRAVALRDINGDGKVDLVTAGGSGVTVRLGNGNGIFGTSTVYGAETESRGVDLQDINGDGIIDLVTTGSTAGVGIATIRLGQGDGSFGSATTYVQESFYSQAVKLYDINQDGFLDLVTAGESTTQGFVTIRLGDGSGTFGAAASYLTQSTSAHSLTIGDTNGDGVPDIVTAGLQGSAGGVAIRAGQGTPGFAGLATFSLSTQLDARKAITLLGNTATTLSSVKSKLGAFESRVNFAVNNALNSLPEYGEALSRIRDADIAQEIATYTRLKILQQAAIAVLAQGNQTASIVLSLLKI